MNDDRVSGRCDAAFGEVRDAFVANFESPGEIGAAVCVVVAGRVVVDLWGGRAIVGGPAWMSDTLVDVFSVGKAMVATALLVLVTRGQLDPDECVAAYWPEFAARGKQDVTVSQLLSHQAGLPGIRHTLPPTAMYDWDLMTRTLAEEEPWWVPGTAHGYHVNTLGFLGGELVRRVDGRGFGTFFAEEVAGPLGADVHFGLGGADLGRVADFVFPTAAEVPAGSGIEDLGWVYRNPAGASGLGVVNTEAWRRAVHPSTNAHATARGVATVYGALAAGGGAILSREALAAAVTEHASGADQVLGRPTRFGFGFQLTQPERPLGPGTSGFGHFGAGGSLGMADPEHQLGFGYVMNRFGQRWQDPRNQALLAATYRSLGVPVNSRV